MDRSPPNVSIPRRMPSTYERTRQCLRNIANYLRRYRNHTVFQAVQHILRRVWPRRERNVTEEIEEEVYEALYQIVESIERFQETLQRTTDRELGVDVEIPIFVPPAGRERAVVEIRLPMNRRSTASSNREAIQIRFPENENPQERNDVFADDYDLSRFPPLHHQDDDFYEPFLTGWARLYASRRQDGEEPVPNVRSGEVLAGESNADHINLDEIEIGEGIAGATEEEIEQLTLLTATDDHANQTCSVCLEQFEFNSPMRMLPCEHVFHPSCIRSWLLRNPSCPIDRRIIFADS